jgi:hypothetical protein
MLSQAKKIVLSAVWSLGPAGTLGGEATAVAASAAVLDALCWTLVPASSDSTSVLSTDGGDSGLVPPVLNS